MEDSVITQTLEELRVITSEETQTYSCWRFNCKIKRIDKIHHNFGPHDSPDELKSNKIKLLTPNQLGLVLMIKTD